jgi:transcriptional/translational regulatory protein YebC/TACO1
VANAKKSGVPKAKIEAAIGRGQGRSSEGAVLEPGVLEVIMPPSIAVIIDFETDKMNRSMFELRTIVTKANGTASATKFLFSRVGRVVFEKTETGVDVDTVMDDAIEAGAEDIEADEEGNIIVWTPPNRSKQICDAVGKKFNLNILSDSTIWNPKEETKQTLDSSNELDLPNFIRVLENLSNHPDVQSIYSNISKGDIPDADWERIQELLDA